MTRRDELEKLAKALVDSVYQRVDRDGELLDYERNLCEKEHLDYLLQVEREVWEKNERAARDAAFLMGNDKFRERNALLDHADWCRKQKEGL